VPGVLDGPTMGRTRSRSSRAQLTSTSAMVGSCTDPAPGRREGVEDPLERPDRLLHCLVLSGEKPNGQREQVEADQKPADQRRPGPTSGVGPLVELLTTPSGCCAFPISPRLGSRPHSC
jgi:hypothetical protein